MSSPTSTAPPPVTSLHIRIGRPDEAAQIAELIVAAFAQYRGRLVPESGALSETADSIRRDLSLPGHAALLAEDAGAVCGCVMTKPENGDLYFGRLSVAPDARGRGIAAALIRGVEARAVALGYPGVLLGVRVALPENQRLFAGLGYVEISREAHPGFDYPTSINMRKALPQRR
jgi:predicted N-acetyltransferase YhbS